MILPSITLKARPSEEGGQWYGVITIDFHRANMVVVQFRATSMDCATPDAAIATCAHYLADAIEKHGSLEAAFNREESGVTHHE